MGYARILGLATRMQFREFLLVETGLQRILRMRRSRFPRTERRRDCSSQFSGGKSMRFLCQELIYFFLFKFSNLFCNNIKAEYRKMVIIICKFPSGKKINIIKHALIVDELSKQVTPENRIALLNEFELIIRLMNACSLFLLLYVLAS